MQAELERLATGGTLESSGVAAGVAGGGDGDEH
jgi:hypothetical protein